MLSGVLRSRRAVEVNIAIMRAFVRFRNLVSADQRLVRKLDELQRRLEGHDGQIQELFEAIRSLTVGPGEPRPRIGFKTEDGQ